MGHARADAARSSGRHDGEAHMRKAAVVGLISLVVSLAGTGLAHASPVHLFTGTGTITGGGRYEFAAGGCSFVHTIDDEAFTGSFIANKVVTPVETGTIHDEQCVATNLVGVGTFTVTTQLGTLSGSFTSVGCGCNGPFTFNFPVTHATGAYAGATGTIEINGTLTFGAFPTFSETGTLTADISRTH
jgi:hypothetical protein